MSHIVREEWESEYVLLIPVPVVELQNLVINRLGCDGAKSKTRRRWVRYARVISACAFVAVAGYALAQPNCVGPLCQHVCKHAAAGALFAAFQLWCRAGKHDPNVAGTVSEFRKDVVHSAKEGILAGIALAMLEAAK